MLKTHMHFHVHCSISLRHRNDLSTDRQADIENAEHTHKTLFSFQWEKIPAICINTDEPGGLC